MDLTRARGALSLVILFVPLLIYGGAMEHERLAPEGELVWGNPAVNGERPAQALAGRWQAGEARATIRPLATMVRAGEHVVWSFRRSGYQADQIVLHGVVAALFSILLARWTGSRWKGLLGGGLLAVHPAASHSVLYLGGLSEILATLFLLLALLRLPPPRPAGRGGTPASARADRGSAWRGEILLGSFAAAAMASHETGYLLLLYVGIFLMGTGRWGEWRRFLAPPAIAAGIVLLWRVLAVSALPEEVRRVPAVDPTTGLPALRLLAWSMSGLGAEVGVTLVPWKLSHEYSWLFAAGGARQAILLAIAAAALGGGAALMIRRRALPGALWACVALAPLLAPAAIPWIVGTLASERNLYPALPGWIGLFLLFGTWISTRRPAIVSGLAGLAVGIALLLGVRTVQRVGDFESDETLLQAAERAHSRNPQILFERGNRSLSQGRYEEATRLYGQAMELRPGFHMAALNKAAALIGRSEYGMALRELSPLVQKVYHRRKLRLIDARVHYHAALCLMQQDSQREAALALERTLLFYPEHLGARGNLGLLYTNAPLYVERGIEHLKFAISREKDPGRRLGLEKNLLRAEGRLRAYIEEHGGPPSQMMPGEVGAIGEPWKEAAAAGM